MAKRRKKGNRIEWWRVVLCIIFPPLAVIDKGVLEFLLVLVLTLLGFIPGIIAALYMIYKR